MSIDIPTLSARLYMGDGPITHEAAVAKLYDDMLTAHKTGILIYKDLLIFKRAVSRVENEAARIILQGLLTAIGGDK